MTRTTPKQRKARRAEDKQMRRDAEEFLAVDANLNATAISGERSIFDRFRSEPTLDQVNRRRDLRTYANMVSTISERYGISEEDVAISTSTVQGKGNVTVDGIVDFWKASMS